MQPFRYHVLACDQHKPDGLPCCKGHGAAEVIALLRKELARLGLLDEVQVTVTGSLGLCERGPNWVVYPDGVWYSGVTPADVLEIVTEHFQQGKPVERLRNPSESSVKAEIIANRNRMLGAQKAQDAAGVLPDDFQELIRGYQSSRIVLTAIELDIFSEVARSGEQANATTLSNTLGTEARGTETLLNALVALSLLTKEGGVYANGLVATRYLAFGAPDDARAALKHNLSLWNTWSSLTDRLRTGKPVDFTSMAQRGAEDWTVPFIAAMHRNAAHRAPLVVRSVGADGVRRLLDIGGGSGAYSIAFAQSNPTLSADIFDLATVLPIAEGHVANAGLSARVRTRAGDLTRDDFGGKSGDSYDLVLLSAICHMLGPDENLAALMPGGRVAIQDHVMNDNGTAPRAGALFAINMLVGTPNGSSFSLTQYRQWLVQAGFSDVQHVRLPGPNDLLLARKA